MRKKEFRKITGIVLIIALFTCIFTYRVYADDTLITDPETAQADTNNQGQNTGNDQGNQEKKEEEKQGETPAGQTDTNVGETPGEGETPTDGSDPAQGGAATPQGETPAAPEDEGKGTDETDATKGEEKSETPQSHEVGDFVVTGPEDNYEFDETNGILTIKGDVSVKNKEDVEVTAQSITVDANCTVVLEGVNINRGLDNSSYPKGQGILIHSPYNVTLTLAEGSSNNVTGSNGNDINATTGSWSGIEVEFNYETKEMASLTINGNGELIATGHSNAAGIGGSNSADNVRNIGRGLYGNITINLSAGGHIKASSPSNGAGIGSSNNPAGGTSNGSYKQYSDNEGWGTITINSDIDSLIEANSGGSGAGIGGGNHMDSGKIIINNGTVNAFGHVGIGCGYGSSQTGGTFEEPNKGPGYYYADVEINGGNITATARSTGSTNDSGAGIGGGEYSDAIIKITGGVIHAYGGKASNSWHHGGAGIGGGYEGHAEVTISGDAVVYAYGGDAASGIGSGPSANDDIKRIGSQGYQGRRGEITCDHTIVKITGGTVYAEAGEKGGAGIGGGVGSDDIEVIISCDNPEYKTIVEAHGSKSSEDIMRGGAGIGGGYSGLSSGESNPAKNKYYFVESNVSVSITGGSVLSVGGWGASGIGSGAENKMADTITLDNTKADIVAYADGTKFAIDTRDLLDDGTTESHTGGRNISGYILQGTFVHNYTPEDEGGNPLVDEQGEVLDQATEGLNDIKIIDDKTGARERLLTGMPAGYRSFAATVSDKGVYTVYTDSEAISNGGGRYFAEYWKDVIDDAYWLSREDQNRFVQYEVKDNLLCDNFYLYPVKSIVVDKEIVLQDGLEKEDVDMTVYFAIREKKYDANGNKDESDDLFIQKDGKKWIQSIEIIDGVPQNKVYFTNVEDKTYEILEVDQDGNVLESGIAYGTTILRKIETRHGEGTDNDGVISNEVWTDRVTVINTYGKDNKIDVVIRKILPTEYKFDEYNGTTVIFKVTVKDSEDNQTYETYVGISLAADPASYNKELGYVYEKKLADIPFSAGDVLNVEEVYAAGYLGEVSEPVLVDENNEKYYRVDTVNTVDEYIPGTGAVNSYHNKTHVSNLVEGGE